MNNKLIALFKSEDSGKVAIAKMGYEQLYKKGERAEELVLRLAQIYIKEKAPAKAIVLLKETLKNNPTLKVFNLLGDVLLARGDTANALLHYAKGLDLEIVQTVTIDACRLFSFIQRLDFNAKQRCLFTLASNETVTYQLRYKFFLQLISNGFLSADARSDISFAESIALWQSIVDSIPCLELPLDTIPDDNNRDVLLLCGQFLSVNHGPTLTALSLAEALHELGYNPILICTNDRSLDDKFSLPNSFIANKWAGYNETKRFRLSTDGVYPEETERNFSTVLYNMKEFGFVNMNGNFRERAENLPLYFTSAIKNKTPIISVGAPSLFAEMLGKYTDVYLLPCSFGIPATAYCQAVVCRKVAPVEIENLGEDYCSGLVETRFPYQIKFKATLEKYRHSGFIVDNKLTFALVGNRLGIEVDAQLLKLMQKIKQRLQSKYEINFKYIGHIGEDAKLIALIQEHDLMAESNFYGATNSIPEALMDCHFYLNPRRHGGGTSALEAMALNIPVLTYRFGDVYHTCGEHFGFDNDDALMEFIDEMLNDSEMVEKSMSELKRQVELNTNIQKVITELTRGRVG